MKVIIYYLIKPEVISKMEKLLQNLTPAEVCEDHFMYAYTENKIIAEMFEKTRNMDQFYKKEVHMSKSEFSKFQSNYRSFHELQPIIFKVSDKTGVESIATYGEEWTCVEENSEHISELLTNICSINPIIFSDKQFDFLKTIGYVGNYSAYNAHGDPKLIFGKGIDDVEDISDQFVKIMRKNQFGAFMYFYKELINPDGFEASQFIKL